MDQHIPGTPPLKNAKRKTTCSSSLAKSRKISEPFVSPLLTRQEALTKELDNQACKRIKFESSCTEHATERIPECLRNVTSTKEKDNVTDCSDKCLSLEESASTKMEMKNLQLLLEKKQEMLRKLNMVKMYRKKNNLSELQELIDKWRKVSQEAANRLLKSTIAEDKLSMARLLDQLHISHQLIQYSVEEDGFSSS